MKEYNHTQIGYLLLIFYSAVILVLCSLYILTDFHPVYLVGMIFMLFVLATFATMTVKVSHQMIKIYFGVGVIHKGFLLRDIETYREVKNPWHYGWGIRFTPRGWLFGVSGRYAIELQMKSGKIYRIGTDDPQGLTQALGEAMIDRG